MFLLKPFSILVLVSGGRKRNEKNGNINIFQTADDFLKFGLHNSYLLSTQLYTIATNKLEGSKWDSAEKVYAIILSLSFIPEFQFAKLAEEADYGYHTLMKYIEALYMQTYYSKKDLAKAWEKNFNHTHNVQLGRTVVDEYLLIAKNKLVTTLEFAKNEAEIEKQLVQKVCDLQCTITVIIADFEPLQQFNRLYKERTGEDLLLFHLRSNFTVEWHVAYYGEL